MDGTGGGCTRYIMPSELGLGAVSSGDVYGNGSTAVKAARPTNVD